MKLFKNWFRAAIAFALVALMFLAGVTPAAIAQTFGPSYTTPQQRITYGATALGFAPASSATDFFTIAGVSGHTVRVHWIKCYGSTTAAASIVIQVVKRSTLDSAGGSPTTLTDVRYNANNPAGAAVVKTYTTNPTLGTLIGAVVSGTLTTNTLAASAFNSGALVFDFSNQNLFIDAATTQVALNANATSFSSGISLNCSVEWEEI